VLTFKESYFSTVHNPAWKKQNKTALELLPQDQSWSPLLSEDRHPAPHPAACGGCWAEQTHHLSAQLPNKGIQKDSQNKPSFCFPSPKPKIS